MLRSTAHDHASAPAVGDPFRVPHVAGTVAIRIDIALSTERGRIVEDTPSKVTAAGTHPGREMNLATRFLLVRADILRRKAARERRRRLYRELAEYSSPSARADFEAILDRYPDGVTWEMRDILAQQAEDRRFPAIGRI